MKETKNFRELLKKELQWDNMNLKQKLISAWFSMSFVGLGLCGESLLVAAIAVANLAAAAYCVVKYVQMEDE